MRRAFEMTACFLVIVAATIVVPYAGLWILGGHDFAWFISSRLFAAIWVIMILMLPTVIR